MIQTPNWRLNVHSKSTAVVFHKLTHNLQLHTESNLVKTSLADVPAVTRVGKQSVVSPETPSGCKWASLWWSDGRPSWRVRESGTCGTHPDVTARSSGTAQTSGWRYYNQDKTQKLVKKYVKEWIYAYIFCVYIVHRYTQMYIVQIKLTEC